MSFPLIKTDKDDSKRIKKHADEFNMLIKKATEMCRDKCKDNGQCTLKCDVKYFDGTYISVFGEYTVRTNGCVSYRFVLSLTYDIKNGEICLSRSFGAGKREYLELKKHFLRCGTDFTKKDFLYSFYLSDGKTVFYKKKEMQVISKCVAECGVHSTTHCIVQ